MLSKRDSLLQPLNCEASLQWQIVVLLFFADGPEENSSKLLSTPFVEDSKHRLRWMAYLEFSHNDDMNTFSLSQVLIKYYSIIVN